MTHEIMFNLDGLVANQFDTIELSNYVFSNNQVFRDGFYDAKMVLVVGGSSCIFPIGSCYAFYNKQIDFEIEDVPDLEIRRRFAVSNNAKIEVFKSFLQFLWFVKDNSIGIHHITGRLVGTSWGNVSHGDNVAPSNASGEFENVTFSNAELVEAHGIWLKYNSLVASANNHPQEDTIISQTEDTEIIRTRFKGHHTNFDYNKTNCIERAMKFLEMARGNEYLIYKIALYMPILECLFSTTTGEITSKLKYRTAFYIGESYQERKDIDRLVDKCYDIRSKYLHGQVYGEKSLKGVSAPILLDYSVRLDALIRRILKKIILHDSDNFIKGDKDQYLNDLVFGKPPDDSGTTSA